MPEAVRTRVEDLCTRCHQPVPPFARRCPNCGNPRQATRMVILWIGVVGVLALVFVAVVMVVAARNADLESAPPTQEEPTVEQTDPLRDAAPQTPPSNAPQQQ